MIVLVTPHRALADGAHIPPQRKDTLLRNTVAQAREKRYSFLFGAEQEFYLFKLDQNGQPTLEPYDQAGYMDIAPEDRGENIRREICLTLEQMGIAPESSYHKEGPGQNEIDFRYSDPLAAAGDGKEVQNGVGGRRQGVVTLLRGLAGVGGPAQEGDVELGAG